jgi:hypothetical protein
MHSYPARGFESPLRRLAAAERRRFATGELTSPR